MITYWDVFMSDGGVYRKCVVGELNKSFIAVSNKRAGQMYVNPRYIVTMILNTDPDVGIAPDGPVDGVIGKIGGTT